MLNTASFEPFAGRTCVSGSSVTPKRRSHQRAMASRSERRPSTVGYDERAGTCALSASAMNAGVISRGSPIDRSMTSTPRSISARFFFSISTKG